MNEITITEENYKNYQDYLDLKKEITQMNHPILLVFTISLIPVVAVIGGLGLTPVINKIAQIFLEKGPISVGIKGLIETGMIATYGIGAGKMIEYFGPKFTKAILLKRFKKEHPNFEMSLTETEVEKEMEEFQKSLEEQQKVEPVKIESNTKISNEVDCPNGNSSNHMSKEERLECLNEEKKFWERVSMEEKGILQEEKRPIQKTFNN